MPFAEAQGYFNREGAADEIEVMVDGPGRGSSALVPALAAAAGPRGAGLDLARRLGGVPRRRSTSSGG